MSQVDGRIGAVWFSLCQLVGGSVGWWQVCAAAQELRPHDDGAPASLRHQKKCSQNRKNQNSPVQIYSKLQMRYNVFWDQSGAIGRRYRRMDEVGTPFCVTIDFDTLEQGTVTVRDRDTTEQQRLTIDELYAFLSKEIDGI